MRVRADRQGTRQESSAGETAHGAPSHLPISPRWRSAAFYARLKAVGIANRAAAKSGTVQIRFILDPPTSLLKEVPLPSQLY